MVSHRSRSWALAGLLGLTVFAAGCPKRQTVVEGTTPLPTEPKFEPKKDAAAEEALAKAESTASAQSKQEAIETYLSVRKAYPESSAGQEALYRVGTLYFELGDYANARKKFNELLFENPLFPKANDAKKQLGLAALEV